MNWYKKSQTETKKYQFYDIDWDVDDEESFASLPVDLIANLDANINIESEGADFLSDKYGFCVNGFQYMEIPDEPNKREQLINKLLDMFQARKINRHELDKQLKALTNKEASKRIICNKCGKQFVIGNLETYQDMALHARRRGWQISNDENICPSCANNSRIPEH